MRSCSWYDTVMPAYVERLRLASARLTDCTSRMCSQVAGTVLIFCVAFITCQAGD